MSQCVLSIKKYHTLSQLEGQRKHNEREIPLANVDHLQSHRNRNMISNNGGDYCKAWHSALDAVEIATGKEIKLRRNAVIAFEVVTSFSHGAEENFDVYEWAEANKNWMCETFGENNVLSCTLHLDEETPHMHTEIIPLDNRNKLCARSFIDGKLSLVKLHDSYAKAMESFGLDRGQKHSKAQKKDLDEFYKAVTTAANAKAPDREIGESTEDYLKRVNEYIKLLEMALCNLQISLDIAKTDLDTIVAQNFARYADVMDFYEDLFENHKNDFDTIKERIKMYRTIERGPLQNGVEELYQKTIETCTEDELLLPKRFKKKKVLLETDYSMDDGGYEGHGVEKEGIVREETLSSHMGHRTSSMDTKAEPRINAIDSLNDVVGLDVEGISSGDGGLKNIAVLNSDEDDK